MAEQKRTRFDSDMSFELVGGTVPETTHNPGTLIGEFAKIIDLKTLLKPPTLGTRDEDFAEFKYEFKNFLIPLQIESRLDLAVTMDHEVGWNEMDEQNKQIGRLLHMILVPSVRNNVKAAVIVRGVESQNGWITWRRLCRTFQPLSSDRWAAVEIALMQPSWTSQNFLMQFTEWEEDLHKWELESGRR